MRGQWAQEQAPPLLRLIGYPSYWGGHDETKPNVEWLGPKRASAIPYPIVSYTRELIMKMRTE